MASLNISLSDLPESQGFEPLPEGWYTATIEKAELKATQGGGKMIAVNYKITGPTHAGRTINFQNLNIKNSNPTAETIGQQQLREIMSAIGLIKIEDTDQLVGNSLQIKLKITPAGTYVKDGVTKSKDAGNEVKGFKAIEGGAPPMPTQSPPATGAPKAPWQK